MNIDQLRIQMETIRRQYPELENDETALLDTLDGATDMRGVLTRLVSALRDNDELITGVHVRLQELAQREDRFEVKSRYFRELIYKVLESSGAKVVALPEATLTLRNNGIRLAGEADPRSLPDDLCKIKREVDRRKVREALDAGREVPGFYLSNAAPSLVVKVK